MEVRGPVRRRAPERRHRAARDRLRAGAVHRARRRDRRRRRSSEAGVSRLPRPDRAAQQAQRQDVPAQPRAVQVDHAPGAVLGPRRAGDPDRRPRPRHVLARPRRRDGRRPGRLRLGQQPLRREPPLRARARTRHRRARGHADRDPPLRHLQPGAHGLPRQRDGARASSSTTTRSPSSTATCAWPPPRSRSGSRTAPGRGEPEHGHGAPAERRTRLDARRLGHRAGQGRADLRRALHGREGLRRHVPAGRPAVHARPVAIRRRRRSSAS